MKMTYIGMNSGSIKERDRLIAALKDLQDRIEDAYNLRDFDLANNLLGDLHAVLASIHMVMRCDAVHATTLPQDGQHSYHWHNAMRPYRQAYVTQCRSARPADDPNDEENEAAQHQVWLIEQGHDYAVFGGVIL